MTDLSDRLERLGLSQYLDAFVSEGFDTWETLADITESDLNYLNVKLGHRRKLQRAVAEYRGQPLDKALASEARKVSSIGSDESGAEPRDVAGASSAAQAGVVGSGTKRKYRRHPKPDINAPERPPSAYVIFSNQVREDLKGQELTFTEIAKVVGERWQILPTGVRETCELQANAAKEKYYTELAEYKKTAEYAQYQEYLVEFKAKHGPSRTAEGKRSKIESESSGGSLAMSNADAVDRGYGPKPVPNLAASVPRSSGSSPPSAGGLAAQSGFRRPSSSSSTALYSDTVNSPVKLDPYSPSTSSPGISAAYHPRDYRHPSRDPSHSGFAGPSGHPASHAYPSPSVYRPGQENWQESKTSQSNYFGALPRRPSRDSPVPPPLIHHNSTLSTESTSSVPPSISLPTIVDSGKGGRILPQPLGFGTASRTSALDIRSSTSTTPSHSGVTLPPITASSLAGDPRSSNWPALLRATELAREAAMKESDPGHDRDDSD